MLSSKEEEICGRENMGADTRLRQYFLHPLLWTFRGLRCMLSGLLRSFSFNILLLLKKQINHKTLETTKNAKPALLPKHSENKHKIFFNNSLRGSKRHRDELVDDTGIKWPGKIIIEPP